MDNTEDRLQEVFFYGLYMDPEILEDKGVRPRNPRKASVKGYQLRVGNRATLLREEDKVAHGILYSLTHAEIDKLYWGAGLDCYVSEAVAVDTEQAGNIVALCCNLLIPPADTETNPGYLNQLEACMHKLGLPAPTI